MRHAASNTGDQLVSALHALGVNFLVGGKGGDESLCKQPARLIAALAQSEEARLRLSLIPLFLEHPEYSLHVREIAEKLEPSSRLTLQCYYSAAVWFSKQHQRSDIHLPDYFSKDLKLTPVGNPEENLQALAKRHKELSGSHVNWLATYQHAEEIWRKGLEYQKG
jgi:hypothetical protein